MFDIKMINISMCAFKSFADIYRTISAVSRNKNTWVEIKNRIKTANYLSYVGEIIN